jgi:hypothetical protein
MRPKTLKINTETGCRIQRTNKKVHKVSVSDDIMADPEVLYPLLHGTL